MMLLMMSIDQDHNNDLENWKVANNPALFLLNLINLRYSFSLSSYSTQPLQRTTSGCPWEALLLPNVQNRQV
ncbi:hypothetical protein KQX54_017180 [Cotesia glomerata]|uniref:Uncharacterized protein n=1 Tax=Cotesia glomerata TaxID=32391 RepID=A0AAV7IJ66_COTGL|nr:hypothetical protein KQX54_017180 [Cotesia glomerata]